MKPNNNSPVIPKKTRIAPKKKATTKRKGRVGMFSGDKTGKKQLLVPVGNTAPWTVNVPPAGSGTTSGANKKRSAKKPMKTRKRKTQQKPVKRNGVQNKAPRARTPNLGNQSSATAWNGMG